MLTWQRFKYASIAGVIVAIFATILPQFLSGQCVCADFPDYVCINPSSSTNLRSLITQGKLLDYADAANTPQNIIVTKESVLNFIDPLNPTEPYILAQINTSSFKQGIYFIHVLDTTNQMNSTYKLLIQH
jgi:hypothetical protein